MKSVFVNRFDGGMANDKYSQAVGEFANTKHFDILSYPNRLYPLRGMTADTASTYIGKIIAGSDGNFYGMGDDTINDPGNPGQDGSLWKKTSASGAWTQFTHTPAALIDYNCLVEYHDASGNRVLIHSTQSNKLAIIQRDDSAGTAHTLSYSNICQGFVHPKDDILYIGYDNKIAVNNNGTWIDAALTLPANYLVTSLTAYGNYLAIGCAPANAGALTGGASLNSIVYLWDRNTSNPLVSESIDWGTGNLRVLNNLDGMLIGITDTRGSTSDILDYDSVTIKSYSGSVPQLIREIPVLKQTSSVPDAVINPRVNFIYGNRHYFSLNIQGGSTSQSYYGLWSLGKSKLSGRYAVTIERIATIDNSETGVLAAAIIGDITCMCYNAVGTLSVSNSGNSAGNLWTATSIYESCVNPGMDTAHAFLKKQLAAFVCTYVPLPSGAQVVAKVRVDNGSWQTIFTDSTTGSVGTEFDMPSTVNTPGRQIEFRLESTGFAQITGYGYKYETTSNKVI